MKTVMLLSSAEKIPERRSYRPTPDGCAGTPWFFEHFWNVKQRIVIINDPFLYQSTGHLVEKPQDTA